MTSISPSRKGRSALHEWWALSVLSLAQALQNRIQAKRRTAEIKVIREVAAPSRDVTVAPRFVDGSWTGSLPQSS